MELNTEIYKTENESLQYINDYEFKTEEVITNDKYANIVKENNNISYIKTDVLHYNNQIDWRGKSHPEIFPPKKCNVLITGHSDFPIDTGIYQQYSNLCNYWFSVNMDIDSNENITKLPLGITNYCDDSNIHKIYGDLGIMKEISDENIEKNKCVYMNININTYPKERGLVYNLFSNLSFVTLGNIENSLEGRKKFLKEIREHKFVLCPRGNGIDTHRLWETLYMKSIPIVRYEKAYCDFTDLPILFVDSWEELVKNDENYYNNKYEEIIKKNGI